MVARLKLKGIDGRAPPGVNTLLQTVRMALVVARTYDMVCSTQGRPHCGKVSSQRLLPSELLEFVASA